MKYYIWLFLILFISCGKKSKIEIETAAVKFGDFYLDVTEEGEIDATNAINISSPAMSWRYGQLKINMIVEDGTLVKKGDTVIVFDQSEVMKSKVDKEASLEIARAELDKLIASHESKINELEANLKVTEIDHKISEINFEQSEYEADITRKEIKLNLEKAKISLNKAKEEIKNQKKIQKEEIQQNLLKIKQLEADVEDAQNTLNKLTVITPEPGIAILRTNWTTKSKWQVGDQIWSGNPMINLPDLSELKVNVDINEVDISKISVGQKVEIRLDAFTDTTFEGKVIKVANLAGFKDNDSKIKVFPIEILIKGTSEKLMPGMTVSCKINVSKLEGKTYVPLEALFKNGAEEYVYIKTISGFKKQVVKTGLSNTDHVIIDKGLKEGEVIALSDPFIDENQEKNEKN